MLKGIEIDILYYLQETKVVGDFINKAVFGVETCITCKGLHPSIRTEDPRDVLILLENVFNVVMFIEECYNGNCKIHINIVPQIIAVKSVETEYLLDALGVHEATAYTIISSEVRFLHFKLSDDDEERVLCRDFITTAITSASKHFDCELNLVIGCFKKGRFVLCKKIKEKIEDPFLRRIANDICLFLFHKKIKGDPQFSFADQSTSVCLKLIDESKISKQILTKKVLSRVYNRLIKVDYQKEMVTVVIFNTPLLKESEPVTYDERNVFECLLQNLKCKEDECYMITTPRNIYMHITLPDKHTVVVPEMWEIEKDLGYKLIFELGSMSSTKRIVSMARKKEGTADEMKALISILTVLVQNQDILRNNDEYVKIISTYIKQFKKK